MRISRGEPFPLVRGSSGGASRQWRPGAGAGAGQVPTTLRTSPHKGPLSPHADQLWLPLAGLPLAGRLLSTWHGDWGGVVVGGGRREGCQGSHPGPSPPDLGEAGSAGNPVAELLVPFTGGGARSPGGVRWQRVQTWTRTTSGLGTFGKACGPFNFSTSVPSPPHLQVSSRLPLSHFHLHSPSLLWPSTVPNHPSCASSPAPPTFW